MEQEASMNLVSELCPQEPQLYYPPALFECQSSCNKGNKFKSLQHEKWGIATAADASEAAGQFAELLQTSVSSDSANQQNYLRKLGFGSRHVHEAKLCIDIMRIRCYCTTRGGNNDN